MSNEPELRREQLFADVRTLASDSEDLIKAMTVDARDRIASLRPQVEASIERARRGIAHLQIDGEAQTRLAAARLQQAAIQHPWRTAGVAAAGGAALGALLGVLLGRR